MALERRAAICYDPVVDDDKTRTTKAIGAAFATLNAMLGAGPKRREPEPVEVVAEAPERSEALEHRELFEAVQARIAQDAAGVKPERKTAKRKKRYLFS